MLISHNHWQEATTISDLGAPLVTCQTLVIIDLCMVLGELALGLWPGDFSVLHATHNRYGDLCQSIAILRSHMRSKNVAKELWILLWRLIRILPLT